MMKYRYFYDPQGQIVGQTAFSTQCWILEMCGISTYIDLDVNVTAATHKVDIDSQTLVPINQ